MCPVIPIAENFCVPCSQRLGYSVKKLNLTFNLSKSPRGTPPDLVACPCCDRIWGDIHSPSLRLDPINDNAGVVGRGGGGPWVDRNPVNNNQNNSQPGGNPNNQPKSSSGSLSNMAERSYPLPQTSDYSAAATGVNIKKAGVKGGGKDSGKSNGSSNGDVRGFFNSVSQDENAPVCVCGGRAISKTTTKEGPNKGRPFYTCPKPR